jgi:hypothetical protein
VILTDDKGVPFVKPDPEDFASSTDFLRAFWAYRDAIADASNKAFEVELRRGSRARGA